MGNVVNRVFDSAGPEGKVRGTPQQIIDKYLLLARDAQTSGDRVNAENFLQHAEHYTRLLSAAQEQAEERRQQQARQNAEEQQLRRAEAPEDGAGGDAQPTEDGAAPDPMRNRRRGRGGAQREGAAEASALETIDVVEGAAPLLVDNAPSEAQQPESEAVAREAGAEAPAEKPAPRRRRRTPKPEEPGDAAAAAE